MTPASEPLSNDVTALRAMLVAAWAERDAERAEKARLAAECDQLAGQNDRLRHLIRQLQRLQFGRRSERLDPDQLNLALEDIEQAIAETEAEQEKADPALKRTRAEPRRAGRASLPEHLPRVEVVIAPEDTACPCCGGAMQVIGEDRSQRLDRVPAQYQVVVTCRPKYACRQCQEGVIQAPAPARLIAGGLPTERLVAHVLVAKYGKRCESTVGSARIDGPGPREQFGEAAIGPVVDELGQHVGEVGLWVDAVQLARLDQRGEHRPVFRPFATAGE
jgi:transposase